MGISFGTDDLAITREIPSLEKSIEEKGKCKYRLSKVQGRTISL
jgi:hypothetical protein